MYKFRDVKCPWCSHIFMLQIHSDITPVYECNDIESNRLGERAVCPKCSAEMAVLDGVLEGMDTKDAKIKLVLSRGI